MERNYIEDKVFEQIDFGEDALQVADYDNCQFINCNFSNSYLSSVNFSECTFQGCNLSMTKLLDTVFNDVKFIDCKMLGLHFEQCNQFLFTTYFEDCNLNLSSFYKVNLKKTTFRNSSLNEVDFTETDLTSAVLENCNLLLAAFVKTILEKADLRTAYNYSIDPELNRIKKAKFSANGIVGLLNKYNIIIE